MDNGIIVIQVIQVGPLRGFGESVLKDNHDQVCFKSRRSQLLTISVHVHIIDIDRQKAVHVRVSKQCPGANANIYGSVFGHSKTSSLRLRTNFNNGQLVALRSSSLRGVSSTFSKSLENELCIGLRPLSNFFFL